MTRTSEVAAQRIVIAHRGASGYLPEHTLAAKAVAHAMGADYLEQDVVLSKDGVPIVLHDVQIDTVTDVAELFPGRARTDGRYYAIDFTVDELKALTVMERADATGRQAFPGRFPRGASSFKIPTLAEEIELVQGLNLSTGREAGIYPEIKAPAWHLAQGHDLSAVVLGVLADYGYGGPDDPVYVQCFDWNETRRIRDELGWRGRLIQLLGENAWNEAPGVDYDALRASDGLVGIAEVADGIGPWMRHVVTGVDAAGKSVVTDLVANAHALRLAVHPYTFRADELPDYAESLEDALRIFLIDAGVDGVFTDFPDRAVAFLRGEPRADPARL
ncbi:MAG TPA: glycerophosphodiester phosphodiesterase [Geminicoccaceae bacterium]|nr:glycerophosphodiester phosphodiesterase [Geminicoccaceae bacterium]